ncbi:MAG: hypothetical protein ACRDCW_12765 [Sarcina sp.]
MYDIRIYKEPNEYKKIVLLSVGIIVLFSWLIYKEFRFMTVDYRDSNLLDNMVSIFVDGIVITLLFIFLIKLSNKILNNDPFLIFDDDQILSKGLIGKASFRWEDIKEYKENKFLGKPNIVLVIKDERRDDISILLRLVYKLNKLMTNGEWMFTKSFLGDEYEKVVELIKEKVR